MERVVGVLCDKKIPARLKGVIYKTAIRPALTYDMEAWPLHKLENKIKLMRDENVEVLPQNQPRRP